MTVPRPLVECVFGTLVLLEYSDDSEIRPEVASRGLEDIVTALSLMAPREQIEFLSICVDVARSYEGIARTEIPALVADSLGLQLPG